MRVQVDKAFPAADVASALALDSPLAAARLCDHHGVAVAGLSDADAEERAREEARADAGTGWILLPAMLGA